MAQTFYGAPAATAEMTEIILRNKVTFLGLLLAIVCLCGALLAIRRNTMRPNGKTNSKT